MQTITLCHVGNPCHFLAFATAALQNATAFATAFAAARLQSCFWEPSSGRGGTRIPSDEESRRLRGGACSPRNVGSGKQGPMLPSSLELPNLRRGLCVQAEDLESHELDAEYAAVLQRLEKVGV